MKIVRNGSWCYSGSVDKPVDIVGLAYDFWFELAKADEILELGETPQPLGQDGLLYYVRFKLGCGMKSGPLDIHVSGCLVGFVPVLLCLVRGTILKRGMQPFLIVTQLDVACNIPDSMPPSRIHGPMNPLHF